MATLGDGQAFKCGRVVLAWLRLTPCQHNTGGKPVLLGISKRGHRYLRTMLIHSARAVLRTAEAKKNQILSAVGCARLRNAIRCGCHKVNIAIARKMARIGWAVLAEALHYDSQLL